MPETKNSNDHSLLIYNVVQRGQSDRTISDMITASWKRCINDHGLTPSIKYRPPILTRAELSSHQERLHILLTCAREEMNLCFQQLADPESTLVLTDTSGVILHVVSSAAMSNDLTALGMSAGAVWSEQAAGTNGMGTCLVLGEPIIVKMSEHFFPSHTSLACSAAPIFDECGKIIAVLDVTSRSPSRQLHALEMVRMAAKTIENRLMEVIYSNAYPIHFHNHLENLYTIHEGKLMVDDMGTILSANHSALHQLGCSSIHDLKGKRYHDVFETTLDTLLKQSLIRSFHPIPVHRTDTSNLFFAVAHLPSSTGAAAIGNTTTTKHRKTQKPAPVSDNDASVYIGDPALREQLALASRVIARDVPVLLTGETGAGKEVFALLLHCQSSRHESPFVAINCASLPENLIESELFGYCAGAFTGAQRGGRRGKILQADGGTLFLDEIGDMPLGLQARLLRVLDERKVTPLGTENSKSVDLQLISASHRNLAELVHQGHFREDLYYRLSGIEIRVPALRERSDRAELIHAILQEEAGQPVMLTGQAHAALMAYPWPGNVRQLRHVLRTIAALRDDGPVDINLLPAFILDHTTAKEPESATPASSPISTMTPLPSTAGYTGLNPLDEAERDMLLHLLNSHHWNISKVAKTLNFSRNTVYRKLHRLRIDLS
uniref:sigma-54-dependent Fis family transcriptional regulator n=1 Tax=Castellaniella defragrans TaxID=75697 RepID=UPI003340A6DD